MALNGPDWCDDVRMADLRAKLKAAEQRVKELEEQLDKALGRSSREFLGATDWICRCGHASDRHYFHTDGDHQPCAECDCMRFRRNHLTGFQPQETKTNNEDTEQPTIQDPALPKELIQLEKLTQHLCKIAEDIIQKAKQDSDPIPEPKDAEFTDNIDLMCKCGHRKPAHVLIISGCRGVNCLCVSFRPQEL